VPGPGGAPDSLPDAGRDRGRPAGPSFGRLTEARGAAYIAGVRYLGIDLGRARIGLALADDVLRTARPLTVLERRGDPSDLGSIKALAAEYEVGKAVLGLPLNMDGSEGASARMARNFAPPLEQALGVPVELFDERLSTFEAEERLRAQGFTVREMKGRVDAEAAAIILQGWLDGRGACAS